LRNDVEDRLDHLAEAFQRSKSFLAAEAIRCWSSGAAWHGRPRPPSGARELVAPKIRHIVPYRVRRQTVKAVCVSRVAAACRGLGAHHCTAASLHLLFTRSSIA
jgi:hypothetical protein